MGGPCGHSAAFQVGGDQALKVTASQARRQAAGQLGRGASELLQPGPEWARPAVAHPGVVVEPQVLQGTQGRQDLRGQRREVVGKQVERHEAAEVVEGMGVHPGHAVLMQEEAVETVQAAEGALGHAGDAVAVQEEEGQASEGSGIDAGQRV
ncbi:hypothetical protein MC885_012424 [Smutsia gigantea]|nr:hypothetical protein MC885_012424 [Smutsia gigantea]